jgi:hypothetical protein
MMEANSRSRHTFPPPVRILGWGTIAALILAPAIAMQFTREVNWTPSDFLFAIVMLGGVGLAFELAVRASGSRAYRGGAGLALMAGLVILWANAAVGIIGDESQSINLWFDAVPLFAMTASMAARFRPMGMAMAMTAVAIAQLGVAVIVQLYGHSVWPFTLAMTAA